MMQTSRSLAVLYTLALSAMCALPMPEGRPRPMWGLRAAYLVSSLRYGKQGQPHQTSSWSGKMGAMSLDIGISLVSPGCGGGGGVRKRYFATFNGTSQSATFNAPIALASGDTATFITYPTDKVAIRYLCDSDVVDAASLPVYTAATTGFYNWPAGLVSSATLNGVTIANSTAAPALGKKNTLILTLSAAARIAKVGIAQAGTGWFKGQYDTITHTPISTGIPIVYELSSGSLTTQYAKGFSSPSANFLTLTNFQSVAPASWELMTYSSQDNWWIGYERIIDPAINTACGVNWSCINNVTISGGVATLINAGTVPQLTQVAGISIGGMYTCTFSVTRFVSESNARVRLGSTGAADVNPNITGVGTYSVKSAIPSTAINFSMLDYGTCEFDVDNISVKRILEDA